MRGRIDFLLDLHLHQGVESVPGPLVRVLRLGAYQLLYMDAVPGYAAVSESVDQARGIGGRKGAGLVNAVLRALQRAGGGSERFPSPADGLLEHLSTWGSHPRWLVARWLSRFGEAATRRIVEAGNSIPRLHLRPIVSDLATATRALADRGIAAEPGPEGSNTLRLPEGTSPVDALSAVQGIIQDPAASGVVGHVHVRPGAWLADLCAAPGGKGIALAGVGARLIFADASEARLSRVRETLARLGFAERIVVARGESPPLRPVDVVLADVPCTGTATLARHPDARWRLEPDDPGRLAALQRRILAGAARIVKPGGTLVYSTCTLEHEENEAVVDSFLSEIDGFELDDARGDARFRVLPGEWSTDGAFAVRLRRSA